MDTRNRWNSQDSGPENVVDRFPVEVEKEGQIVGHLNKGNSGRFAKITFYFLRENHGNTYQVKVWVKGST